MRKHPKNCDCRQYIENVGGHSIITLAHKLLRTVFFMLKDGQGHPRPAGDFFHVKIAIAPIY
jgi:hypothetical protein